MRLVATTETLDTVLERGGAVYLWPKASRCCSAFTYTLEVATEPPAREFEHIHGGSGVEVFATPGLRRPDELHLELSRRGELRAYWNGQAWIG